MNDSEVQRLLDNLASLKDELESLGCAVSITVKTRVASPSPTDPIQQQLKIEAEALDKELDKLWQEKPLKSDIHAYYEWASKRSKLMKRQFDVHAQILERIKQTRGA